MSKLVQGYKIAALLILAILFACQRPPHPPTDLIKDPRAQSATIPGAMKTIVVEHASQELIQQYFPESRSRRGDLYIGEIVGIAHEPLTIVFSDGVVVFPGRMNRRVISFGCWALLFSKTGSTIPDLEHTKPC